MSKAPLISDEFVVRQVSVPKQDVVFVRGVFEASDGVAAVFSVAGGDLTFAAHPSRAAELDSLLADLQAELGSSVMLFEFESTPAL